MIEQMFFGQYQHTLDEKGRLTVPADFRDQLSEGAYLTQGFDNNLRLMSVEEFRKLYRRISEMSTTDPSARKLRRLIFANAKPVEIDRVGRILIPQFLRDVAGLDSSAVIVGVGESIEIWSIEEWERQSIDLQHASENGEQFAALDL
jgi:MraZ protein